MFDSIEVYQIVEVSEEQELGLLFINDLKSDKHI